MTTFLSHYVLEADPNDVEPLNYNYSRAMTLLDNNTGQQRIYDVSGFVSQQYSWFAHGREQHWRLRELFTMLDGRRTPLWLPTYYNDFEFLGYGEANFLFNVRRCDYTKMGGPRYPNRRYILIHMRDGTRHYRTIGGSALLDDETEQLALLEGVDGMTPTNVRRISFLILSRLDQDEIEFTHYSDTVGVTTVVAAFHNLAGVVNIEEHEVPL